ncbi:MAG TPA: hypothetical protein VIE37_20250 [Methylomirabilota bacterium]|jgi:hypothetical protein
MAACGVMAISALAIIPLALMFFFFQRAFIQGIALAGLKDESARKWILGLRSCVDGSKRDRT